MKNQTKTQTLKIRQLNQVMAYETVTGDIVRRRKDAVDVKYARKVAVFQSTDGKTVSINAYDILKTNVSRQKAQHMGKYLKHFNESTQKAKECAKLAPIGCRNTVYDIVLKQHLANFDKTHKVPNKLVK